MEATYSSDIAFTPTVKAIHGCKGSRRAGPVRTIWLEARCRLPYPPPMTKRFPFKCFKTRPEIICLAVMPYVRYPL